VQNRASDQVREVGNKQAVMDEIKFLGLAARGIDQEGNLGKSKK
jgi:hypothetical protein